MVSALTEEGQDNCPPREQVDLAAKKILDNKTVADFVTTTSRRIFEGFNVNLDFLAKDQSAWENNESFQSAHQVLSKVAAVNDFAECGVSLIQDYNQILTKDEEQWQFLQQVVEFHRRHFPA